MVGKNLLSRYRARAGVDLKMYSETVLPRILEQVVNCKDELAQPYLLDVLIQVFPDEYHLATFQEVFSTMAMLRPNVRVGSILNALLGRLLSYAEETPQAKTEFQAANVFPKSFECCRSIIEAHDDVPAKEIIGMYATTRCWPLRESCNSRTRRRWMRFSSPSANLSRLKLPITEQEVMRQLAALLSDPLESCELSTMLAKSFPQVIALLDASSKKEVALGIIQTLLKNRSTLSSVEEVELLYNFIDCVVIGDVDEDGADDKEKSCAASQRAKRRRQGCALDQGARRRLRAPTRDAERRVRRLAQGGARRIRYTFPSLVFAGIACGRDIARRASRKARRARGFRR